MVPAGALARMLFGDGKGGARPGGSQARSIPQQAAAAGAPVHAGLPQHFSWVRTARGADVTFVDLDRLTAEHLGNARAVAGAAVGPKNAGMMRRADVVPEELKRRRSSKVWAYVEGAFAGDG